MLEWINRIRNLDPRKWKPWQIVLAIALTIVGLWLLSFIFSLAMTLLPVAIGVILVYFAYRWLSSRSEDIPAEMKMSQKEKNVDQALKNVKAQKSQDDLAILELDTSALAIEEEADNEKLIVRQVVNPETGFKEPDISRLIAHEEAKLKEAKQVTDDVKAQLEARRKRLIDSNKKG